MSKEERMAYEDSLKYYRDLKNSLDTAKEEGYAQAQEKYRVEMEEYLLKQEEERRQKEEAIQKHEESMHHLTIAIKNMLAKGMPAEEIAHMMDIPVEEVKRLGGF